MPVLGLLRFLCLRPISQRVPNFSERKCYHIKKLSNKTAKFQMPYMLTLESQCIWVVIERVLIFRTRPNRKRINKKWFHHVSIFYNGVHSIILYTFRYYSTYKVVVSTCGCHSGQPRVISHPDLDAHLSFFLFSSLQDFINGLEQTDALIFSSN